MQTAGGTMDGGQIPPALLQQHRQHKDDGGIAEASPDLHSVPWSITRWWQGIKRPPSNEHDFPNRPLFKNSQLIVENQEKYTEYKRLN